MVSAAMRLHRPVRTYPVAVAAADDAPMTKRGLRRTVLDARRGITAEARQRDGVGFAERLAGLRVLPAEGGTVTAYLARDDEPDTRPLIAMLLSRGTTVLLPVLLPDRDLAWAPYDPATVRTSELGISEPAVPLLGPDRIVEVDALVCPALAVDVTGHRLGRGGGSYDRVLSRFARPESVIALVYDTEIVDRLPTDDHDERVGWLVTPTRVVRAVA
jgi:5-formyltetrahydrofolate cyclo-ligase